MKLVVGIGTRTRGDDGIGPRVAEQVAALALPGVRVVTDGEPLALIDLFYQQDDVVVVDALLPQGEPGRVCVWRADSLPAGRAGRFLGSHGVGVLEAVGLAHALDQLPARLTVVGVEAETLEAGAPLSGSVLDHLGEATQAVCAALTQASAPMSR